MLKSVSETRDDVRDYIKRFHALRRTGGRLDSVLNKGAAGKATAHEIRMLADELRVTALEGRALLGKGDVNTVLTEDEMHDLVAITEEIEAGVTEALEMTDSDEVFKKLPKQRRDELTERIGIDATAADLLRARFRGDRRQQSNPGNGNGDVNGGGKK